MGPAKSLESAKAYISTISKKHPKADHNCWAYIVGETGDLFHSSDAGEPSGTAGKPMLNALKKYDMTHVAAVVTRYFGGVKLGVKGLIKAYAQSVEHTIQSQLLIQQIRMVTMTVTVNYEFNDTLINRLKTYDVGVQQTHYDENVTHLLDVPFFQLEAVKILLSEYHSKGLLRSLTLN